LFAADTPGIEQVELQKLYYRFETEAKARNSVTGLNYSVSI